MEYFEKVRELAESLLETPEGENFKVKKYVFDGDDEAKQQLNDYESKRREVEELMRSNPGGMNTFDEERKDLNDKMDIVKSSKVIMDYFTAQNEFNALVNQALDLFRSIISEETSDDQSEGGCGSSGGCGGCTGCH